MDGYHYKTCGLDDVYLLNGYEIIEYGDEKAISIRDIDGLHRVIALALVHQETRLTGKEFRFLRIELDRSQKAVGRWFGLTDQAIAIWEKNDRVPQWADAIVRLLYLDRYGEKSEIKIILEMLSKIDGTVDRGDICFQESNEGWILQAA